MENTPERNNENSSRPSIDGIVLIKKSDKKKIFENDIIVEARNYFSQKEVKQKTAKIIGWPLALVMIFVFAVMPIKIIETGSALKAKASDSINGMKVVFDFIDKKDYKGAKSELATLNSNIGDLDKNLKEINQKGYFFTRYLPIKSGIIEDENTFNAVLSLSKIGGSLIDDLEYIQEINIEEGKDNTEIIGKIKELNIKLGLLKNDFNTLIDNINRINIDSLEGEEKDYAKIIKENSQRINDYYQASLVLTKKLPKILGKDYDQKILVLLENDTELRATGGFIGSYGIITLRNGNIKDIKIDSIYNPDGQSSKINTPPEPLKMISDNLKMRDANWYPDFETSAKNIISLYESEGGFTPDLVLAMDTKVFTDILEILGPINIEKYGIEINKDNFIKTTQYKTSVDYNQEDKNPKKFLDDLAPLLIKRFFESEKEIKNQVFSSLYNNLDEKHILLYSPDEELQKGLKKIDLTGSIKNHAFDYFYYVNTNIGGLKTNGEIKEYLEHYIYEKDGDIIHKTTLTRDHQGSYDWPSGINYAYLRFYIPKGAEILSVSGFEKKDSIRKDSVTDMIYLEDRPDKYLGKAGISDVDQYEEGGKLVIGAWQVVKPEEKVISEIEYKIPKKILFNSSIGDYSLLIQKQAGVKEQEIKLKVEYSQENIKELTLTLKKDIFIDFK